MKSEITNFDRIPGMAMPERNAWLSLAAMLVAFVPYFVIVTRMAPSTPTVLTQLAVLAGFAILQAIILAGGSIYFRLRWPRDFNNRTDERDRAIASRGISVAYYALISCTIVVGIVMPFNSGGWSIINAAIAAIVLSETIHYGVVVALYRRQA